MPLLFINMIHRVIHSINRYMRVYRCDGHSAGLEWMNQYVVPLLLLLIDYWRRPLWSSKHTNNHVITNHVKRHKENDPGSPTKPGDWECYFLWGGPIGLLRESGTEAETWKKKQQPDKSENSKQREHLYEGPESEKSFPFLVQIGGRLVFLDRSAAGRVAPCHWTAGKEHHGGPQGSGKHAKFYSEAQAFGCLNQRRDTNSFICLLKGSFWLQCEEWIGDGTSQESKRPVSLWDRRQVEWRQKDMKRS